MIKSGTIPVAIDCCRCHCRLADSPALGGCHCRLPEWYDPAISFRFVLSRSFFATNSLPRAAKVVQPCAHDHGCILRRHRISTLVGSLCPGREHAPGASGSNEGWDPFLGAENTFNVRRRGFPSLDPLVPGESPCPGQRESTDRIRRRRNIQPRSCVHGCAIFTSLG